MSKSEFQYHSVKTVYYQLIHHHAGVFIFFFSSTNSKMWIITVVRTVPTHTFLPIWPGICQRQEKGHHPSLHNHLLLNLGTFFPSKRHHFRAKKCKADKGIQLKRVHEWSQNGRNAPENPNGSGQWKQGRRAALHSNKRWAWNRHLNSKGVQKDLLFHFLHIRIFSDTVVKVQGYHHDPTLIGFNCLTAPSQYYLQKVLHINLSLILNCHKLFNKRKQKSLRRFCTWEIKVFTRAVHEMIPMSFAFYKEAH